MICEENIYGSCLEGIGIPDGGIAVIDRDMQPNIFDVVYCNNPVGAISGFLKQIVQTGKNAIVRTRYLDDSKNFMFFAPEIYGVVLEVLDFDRNVVWRRPEPVEYTKVHHASWKRIDENLLKCTRCFAWVRKDCVEGKNNPPSFCPNCGATVNTETGERRKRTERFAPGETIRTLNMSTRVTNALLRAGISTLEALEECFQDGYLGNIRNLGRIGIAEIENAISKLKEDKSCMN